MDETLRQLIGHIFELEIKNAQLEQQLEAQNKKEPQFLPAGTDAPPAPTHVTE